MFRESMCRPNTHSEKYSEKFLNRYLSSSTRAESWTLNYQNINLEIMSYVQQYFC